MKGRIVKGTLMFGALAALGIFIPAILGHDAGLSTANVTKWLGAVGMLAWLGFLLRAAGGNLAVIEESDPSPVVPRTLDSDPLANSSATMPLERRIEAAAEASKQHGRTIGILYYNVDIYRQIARTSGAAAANSAMESVIGLLKSRLRKTDRVERLGDGRFVVCIVLLSDKHNLMLIRDRLDAAMHSFKNDCCHGYAIAPAAGMSMYPLGGYTGEGLIATARVQFESIRAERKRADAKNRRRLAEPGKNNKKRDDAETQPANTASRQAALSIVSQ